MRFVVSFLIVMVLCAAPNCDARYGEGVSLFFFPSDHHLCKLWVQKLKTDDQFWPSKHAKLCERHFAEDAFHPMSPWRARQLGYSRPRISLKKDSVPSIFDFTPRVLKRKNDNPPELGPAKTRKSGGAAVKREQIRAKRVRKWFKFKMLSFKMSLV